MVSKVQADSAFLANAQATVDYGRKLAVGLEAGVLVYLSGDLGAGKTTLVRGILRGLGYSGAVKSPTYTLLEPYDLPTLAVYHFDFYRIGDSRELEFIGIDELMDSDAVKLVEWPERGADRIPVADVQITLQVDNEGRRIEVSITR
ncbi:MAG: tRNA (adenosine(37)-N6)-threonylcarbamoyltransferase complex ATPase subunit type 1 TsaE [Gammaproteobacteria bacterium]|nr:tRNA (adenosine(37)-N6)-threonylcarbamoyltransferase complex ATPase subunit type 1 TsaE [Gammaproteobacteria bacterium]